MRRLLLAVAVVVMTLVVPARPAGAHAVLRASEPLDRQVMSDPPGRVLLRFSESVAVSSTSVRVLDHHGETVVGKGAAHVKGNDAEVVLPLPALEEGTYVATWRVVSADSHPAVGAISFRIGEATDDFHIGASLLEAPKGDRAVGTTFGVVRFLLFAAVILLVGSTAFLAGLWPAGWARPGARRLVGGAWLGALASTLGAIALQGAYSTGGGLADLLSPTVLADVLRSRYGDASAARVVLLLDAGVLVLVLRRWRPHRAVARPAVLGVGAVGGLGLLLSISWIGHASTGRFPAAAMALDVAHLAAVSVWLGGLATLGVLVLRRRSDGDVEQAGAVAARFSSLAFAAVVVIVVTGSLQSWRQLDGLGEFTSTTFGRLLLSKIVLVALILIVARSSRRWVHRMRAAPAVALSPGPGAAASSEPGGRLSRLRRWVAVETALAVAVVGVTAGLVNAVPARSAADTPGPALPFSTELTKDGVELSITLEPARTGLDDLHVYVISRDGRFAEPGRPIDALEVTASMRLDKGDTGPIKVPLVENAPGHWSAFGFPVPIAGTWALEVAALVSDIDLVRVRSDVSIR